MKIYEDHKVLVEIGDLDFTLRRPRFAEPVNLCSACCLLIADKFYVMGLKKGHPKMFFHEKCCPGVVIADDTPNQDWLQ